MARYLRVKHILYFKMKDGETMEEAENRLISLFYDNDIEFSCFMNGDESVVNEVGEPV